MTAAEIVARELEHIRCRATRANGKACRTRMLVIGRLDPLVFFETSRDRDADIAWNERVQR